MSEIDPENGDIIENPNPEAETEPVEPESETAFNLNNESQSQVDTSPSAERPESELQSDSHNSSSTFHSPQSLSADYGNSASSQNVDGGEEPESDTAAYFPLRCDSDTQNVSEVESTISRPVNRDEFSQGLVSSRDDEAEGDHCDRPESSDPDDQSTEQPESYINSNDGRTESESRYSDGSGDNMSVTECDKVDNANVSASIACVDLPHDSDNIYAPGQQCSLSAHSGVDGESSVGNASAILRDDCDIVDRDKSVVGLSFITEQFHSCPDSNISQATSQTKVSETFEPECDQLNREACNNSNFQVSPENRLDESCDRSIQDSGHVTTSSKDDSQSSEVKNQLPNKKSMSHDSQNIPPDEGSSPVSLHLLPVKVTSLSESDTEHLPVVESTPNLDTVVHNDLASNSSNRPVINSIQQQEVQECQEAVVIDSNETIPVKQMQQIASAVQQDYVEAEAYQQQDSHNSCDQKVSSECDSLETAVCVQMKTSQQNKSVMLSAQIEDDLLCQLDAELDSTKPSSQDEAIPSRHATVKASRCSNNNFMKEDVSSKVTDLINGPENDEHEKDQQIIRLKTDIEDAQEELTAALQKCKSLKKENDRLKDRNADDLYLPQIKELEYTIAHQQKDITALKDKLVSHDTAAKKAIVNIQAEMKTRIDQVSKLYEESVREKDSMVVKFAQSEQRYLESLRQIDKLDAKLKDFLKEKELMINKMKGLKTEKQKMALDLNNKTLELNNMFKELEKRREAASSADVRIKWGENKIKAETEAHKETKAAFEKLNLKLKDKQLEADQLRRDCQKMIQQYQESEEFKSNSLDIELKKKQSELQLQMQEKSDQEELHVMTKRELDSLKVKHKDNVEELNTAKDKVKCLEDERLQNEQTLSKFKEIMQKQKNENRDLQDKVDKLTLVQDDFHRAQGVIKSLDKDITELKVSNKDLLQDMDACRRRESEVLHLTETLSKKNAELQSENTISNNKISSLSSELENYKMELHLFDSNAKSLENKLTEELKETTAQLEKLKVKLSEKSTAVEQLTRLIEDEKDENKTLKRRHASNIKDLTRQLQQLRKRLECFENHGENGKDSTSLGSRTSSSNSLNTIENSTNHQPPGSTSSGSTQSSRAPSQEQDYPVITEQIQVDKQVLIERIVKLQRGLARKNEKIEFTEDQNNQLLHEIQNKNKLIQSYVMREESGQLSSDYMDLNKALLAKKGGIMASVYTSHAVDGHMNLDLSLEINKKLQAVLEDTLLKNITLKESLDTLGQEISRLSQENRRLQLQLQQR